jgi:hypothetical protein
VYAAIETQVLPLDIAGQQPAASTREAGAAVVRALA